RPPVPHPNSIAVLFLHVCPQGGGARDPRGFDASSVRPQQKNAHDSATAAHLDRTTEDRPHEQARYSEAFVRRVRGPGDSEPAGAVVYKRRVSVAPAPSHRRRSIGAAFD